jgi:hypothetical protein
MISGVKIRASWLLLSAALVLAPLARASVAIELTVGDLTREADLVVIGTVSSTRAVWSQDHRRITTRVVLQPEAAWKGRIPAAGIVVLLPGGQLDGLGQEVSGVPEAAVGERVVLFLRRRGPWFRLVGMAQGFFRVPPVTDGSAAQAIRNYDGLKLVPGDSARTPVPEPLSLSLDGLQARVAEAVMAGPVR